MELLTMVMDRTSDTPKSTEHIRDMINNWEQKHADNSHAEEPKQEQAWSFFYDEDVNPGRVFVIINIGIVAQWLYHKHTPIHK